MHWSWDELVSVPPEVYVALVEWVREKECPLVQRL